MRCLCVCKCISSSAMSVSGVIVSVPVKTHTHLSRAESPGMGDTDTCLSFRGLAGFLLSQMAGCFLAPSLTPRLPLSLSCSHFLLNSLSLSVSVFVSYKICICLPLLLLGRFVLSSFLSLLSNSNLLPLIWLYTHFITLHVALCVSLSLPSDPSAFHLSPHRWSGES